MDYPKSVPGVGLVDGKFVDEDQVNGTPGSLIPAQWGNDVTDEILNVVREVGDEPAEAQKNQLVGAIWKMFRSATASATETLRGVLRVGTQTEVNAGVLDNVAVTPKKLRAGFAISLTARGYIAFPSWMGGLIIQWIRSELMGNGTVTSYPLAYPTEVFGTWPIHFSPGATGAQYFSVKNLSTAQFEILLPTGNSITTSVISIGR